MRWNNMATIYKQIDYNTGMTCNFKFELIQKLCSVSIY